MTLTKIRITEREMLVLTLLAHGYENKEIGIELYMSEETVKSHVKNLLQKLNARNRTHAVALALRTGILNG